MRRQEKSRCVICQELYEVGRGLTCSDECHEELVRRLIARFGEFKKVVRASTGIAYRVPTRDIIEKRIREQDLDQYPVWEEEKTLICMPASFKGYVVPGSLPNKCSKCGRLVWVSPSSWLIMQDNPMQDNPGMAILCKPCALDQVKKAKHPKIEDITPAQAEEIEEYLKQGGS